MNIILQNDTVWRYRGAHVVARHGLVITPIRSLPSPRLPCNAIRFYFSCPYLSDFASVYSRAIHKQ